MKEIFPGEGAELKKLKFRIQPGNTYILKQVKGKKARRRQRRMFRHAGGIMMISG